MFPYRVALRINKRSPGDTPKMAGIHRMLFEEKLPPKVVMERIIANKWIGGVLNSEEEVVASKIDKHIAFFNERAIRLNYVVHRNMYKQPYTHEVANDTYFLKRDLTAVSGKEFRIGEGCKVAAWDDEFLANLITA